jgi:hypothetical protein
MFSWIGSSVELSSGDPRQETKGDRKNKRTDFIISIADFNDTRKLTAAILARGIIGESNFDASIHSNLNNRRCKGK